MIRIGLLKYWQPYNFNININLSVGVSPTDIVDFSPLHYNPSRKGRTISSATHGFPLPSYAILHPVLSPYPDVAQPHHSVPSDHF